MNRVDIKNYLISELNTVSGLTIKFDVATTEQLDTANLPAVYFFYSTDTPDSNNQGQVRSGPTEYNYTLTFNFGIIADSVSSLEETIEKLEKKLNTNRKNDKFLFSKPTGIRVGRNEKSSRNIYFAEMTYEFNYTNGFYEELKDVKLKDNNTIEVAI